MAIDIDGISLYSKKNLDAAQQFSVVRPEIRTIEVEWNRIAAYQAHVLGRDAAHLALWDGSGGPTGESNEGLI